MIYIIELIEIEFFFFLGLIYSIITKYYLGYFCENHPVTRDQMMTSAWMDDTYAVQSSKLIHLMSNVSIFANLKTPCAISMALNGLFDVDLYSFIHSFIPFYLIEIHFSFDRISYVLNEPHNLYDGWYQNEAKSVFTFPNKLFISPKYLLFFSIQSIYRNECDRLAHLNDLRWHIALVSTR